MKGFLVPKSINLHVKKPRKMKYIATFLLFVFFMQAVHAFPTQTKATQASTEVLTKAETSIFTPIQRQITKWSIIINREIPKRMKKLKNEPSMSVIFTTAFFALLYGVLHTLGPGHGKMVVATYFLSNDAHIKRGIWVGSQVAVTHVGGAVLIVFFTDIALKNVISNPENQALWVKLISYTLIMTIGVFMAFQAIRKLVHKHENVHSCGHCAKHSHGDNHKKETLMSWVVGAVPCTGSLLILVYAMAYEVLWLGLFMVCCIAVGMAIAMIAIGVLCIYGKKNVVDRLTLEQSKNFKIQPLIEIAGALVIILIGYALISPEQLALLSF